MAIMYLTKQKIIMSAKMWMGREGIGIWEYV